ncbi:hypothetical protein LXL04_019465 [Taraxacum kok-saghyz]
MKLEAAKHVEAVGVMKLEDKELTAVKLLNLLGRRCRRAACWIVDAVVVAAGGRAQPRSNGKEDRLRRSPMQVESKGRSVVKKNGMRAKEEVKKLGCELCNKIRLRPNVYKSVTGHVWRVVKDNKKWKQLPLMDEIAKRGKRRNKLSTSHLPNSQDDPYNVDVEDDLPNPPSRNLPMGRDRSKKKAKTSSSSFARSDELAEIRSQP